MLFFVGALLRMYYSDGITLKSWNIGSIQDSAPLKINLTWDGLTGSTITCIINDISYTSVAELEWVGNSNGCRQ